MVLSEGSPNTVVFGSQPKLRITSLTIAAMMGLSFSSIGLYAMDGSMPANLSPCSQISHQRWDWNAELDVRRVECLNPHTAAQTGAMPGRLVNPKSAISNPKSQIKARSEE